MQFGFPDMQISGVGDVRNKPLTVSQLADIRMRADMIDDAQVRNDMFAMIGEIERLRRNISKEK